MPNLTLKSEQTIEGQIMVELAVLEEKVTSLTKHIDTLTEEIKELKRIQVDRIENHEKRISILEERVARFIWILNIITGVLITAIVGGILSLILK